MTVLVAPDSFKGTYTAEQVAAAVAAGVAAGGVAAVQLPVADGGEGTYAALCRGMRARPFPVEVLNPWGAPAAAEIGLTADGTAIVELAQASGIALPHAGDRDPVSASTYGTGMMIAAAVRHGATRILVAAGGSATTDGGAGAVRAIQEAGGLRGAALTVLSDVTTPFEDAARVFGPQKGADPATVERLEERLRTLAAGYPRNPCGIARTGAAGGFAGGLWANFGAELVSGADAVLDAVGFDEALAAATAVAVGEGRLDSQTGEGKIISAILRRVAGSGRNIPVFAVVGSVAEDLGGYRSNFADVLIASDSPAMSRAGEAIAAVVKAPAVNR